MSLIKDNEVINRIIFSVKTYFENIFNEHMTDVEMYVSDDINVDTRIFIEVDDDEILPQTNGRYIEPNNLTSNPVILINIEIFYTEGYSFVSTMLHELTHASDYKKFNQQYCNGNWEILRELPNFASFYYWSEYHARVVSIVHMRILTSLMYPQDCVYNESDIKDEMLHGQLPRCNQELIKDINSNESTILDIIKYCARFYVCKLYNPHLTLKQHMPKQIYDKFPMIDVLYLDLEIMQSYEEFSKYQYVLSVVLDSFL